jgi:hypothetical protein
MNPPPWIKLTFLIGGIYDAVIGLGFLLFAGRIFEAGGITPPNHPGYVQFPALLLIIFGWMFLRISHDPVRHRDQMLYAMGLKIAYCAVVFGHWLSGGVPGIWKPFAWADLVFLALFFVAWRTTVAGAEKAPRR